MREVVAALPTRVASGDGRARTGDHPSRPATGVTFSSILAAAQAGAPWAVESLWRSQSPAIYGYLRLQGAAEPENLTSEVFLGVVRSLGSFRGTEDRFRSWIFTVAHRRLVDERRPAGRPARRDRRDDGDDVTGLAEDRVRELCDSLLADQRDVLLLRVLGGLTVGEVARAVGWTPAGVKSLQHRALVALRNRLVPRPPAPQAGAGAGLRGPNAVPGLRGPNPIALWLDDLRRAADPPPPAPRGELAQLLVTGRGGPSGTATTNGTAPPQQATGRPKLRLLSGGNTT